MGIKNKSLISITDYNKEEYLKILDVASKFEEWRDRNENRRLLERYVVASLFFEPSTRTKLSFDSAVSRLGGKVIGFSDISTTSVQKGESLKDTIKTVNCYCDLIVMRHPRDGSARYASEIATVPVINAGDGSNQHPTQTLLDMYSIQKTQGTLENLSICFVGDLKYGRTVHSLTQALSNFNCNFYFCSPEELKIPDEIKFHLNETNLKYEEIDNFIDVISEIDILYMTRVQKERFSDPIEYERVKNAYVLRDNMLQGTKENMKVMHPLPRVSEISTDVDTNQKAYYFEQPLNGIYVRQAIITQILGIYTETTLSAYGEEKEGDYRRK